MLFVVSAEDKRRSLADLRDSSLFQAKEKLSVSVKAMSALYLSKVAPQESANTFIKQVNSCVYCSLSCLVDVLRYSMQNMSLPPDAILLLSAQSGMQMNH